MTKEEKQLLLKDLCARLPYGIKCKIHYTFNNETTFGEDIAAEEDDVLVKIDAQNQSAYFDWYGDFINIEDVKPYLRPMSSMTEEEENEWWKFADKNTIVETHSYSINWLTAHHLDYLGLIPKGLALPATDGMYN